MDDSHIRITRDNETSALGCSTKDSLEWLADWSGLRMVRYRPPVERIDRHIVGRHPVLTLLCEGKVQSHMRIGLREHHTQVQTNELMFYSGGREIDYGHWRSQGATLISIELAPNRLQMLDPDDTRLVERPLIGQPRISDDELAALMRSLWREVEAGCPNGRLFADTLCLGLTTHVHRRFGQGRATKAETGARLTAAQLRRIDDYIAQHLDRPISLDDLAREAGLSRFHFTRVFSNTLGHTPYQHVIKKRLERAYQLLVGSQLSVADVALSTGFSSQAHLSNLCRRVLGTTPSSLRAYR